MHSYSPLHGGLTSVVIEKRLVKQEPQLQAVVHVRAKMICLAEAAVREGMPLSQQALCGVHQFVQPDDTTLHIKAHPRQPLPLFPKQFELPASA
mmetsp:Transcript_20588/g.24725  ORF Transcript_20588/g.24725 Transcript_20588/m.24725 type:complete len:94 (-) Transcript_20588:826-1107(-)